jgi:hypothetical protein
LEVLLLLWRRQAHQHVAAGVKAGSRAEKVGQVGQVAIVVFVIVVVVVRSHDP